ncbi:ATP-binding protein [Flammeovirgaceae bacterium SG7u.111]|nr:ATP-binding protein [Flammeovirgaceae bacterium SG7u.132]WPO37430.1 ATP-binding protein [Flammeovirgaceae bacterium SG7u.111]
MNLSFKDRIAFYYMVATAVIMAIVFGIIYFVVQTTVWNNLDNDLSYEAEKHTKEIKISGDSLEFLNKREWEEREHREIQVNPVFIQLLNKKGKLMDKSPNLKEDYLPFEKTKFEGHFDAKLSNRNIRQAQLPIERKGEVKGYILAAMSSESSRSILHNLRKVLTFSYLIVLVGLYFTSRFLAGRSITPVKQITNTITRITKNNLKERVDLPQHKDEIHHLSSNFNALLERIEGALEREKQFTSDASHELRTPLSTLRGTLEVLVRKPRTQEQYEEKIHYSLSEIERMATIIEQLLLLARLDPNANLHPDSLISLPALIDESISRFKKSIMKKNLKINMEGQQEEEALVPNYYSNLIVDNILSNAVKYSSNNATIKIRIDVVDKQTICSIQDEGIGIKEEDLAHIYTSFFRSDSLNHKHITGNGLGLPIVKKCAEAIDATLDISSDLGKGTTVTIRF